MTWQALFDQAASFDVDEDEVRDAVERRRREGSE